MRLLDSGVRRGDTKTFEVQTRLGDDVTIGRDSTSTIENPSSALLFDFLSDASHTTSTALSATSSIDFGTPVSAVSDSVGAD